MFAGEKAESIQYKNYLELDVQRRHYNSTQLSQILCPKGLV